MHLEKPAMSKPSSLSRHLPVASVVALIQAALFSYGCAKVAGFQDFTADLPAVAGGSASTQAGGESSSGGALSQGGAAGMVTTTSAGGRAATGGTTNRFDQGGAGQGGSTCGNFNQACCSGDLCTATSSVCNTVTGRCESCGAIGGRCCAATTSCTAGGCCVNSVCIAAGQTCGASNGTCTGGHCANCGQSAEGCCSNTCEYGLECNAATCRACGANGQSCCNNGGWPLCNAGAVCVSTTGALAATCSTTCGAKGQSCCGGNLCQQASGLSCTGNVCN